VAAVEVPRTRGSLWRHADFRRLWTGDTISQFGTAVSQLALPLLAILVLEASTFEVGVLTACETVAFLLVGLPAGAWVDRMRRRRVLLTNDAIRVVAIGSLPVAAALGVLTLGQLYAVALVASFCTVFFDIAYQSYLPELIGATDLVEGNTKLQASQAVALVSGPSIGGLLVQAITAPYAMAVDAASFLWSAVWISRIRTRPARPQREPGSSLRHEIGEGLRFVAGHRALRAITMTTAASNLMSGADTGLVIILLARNLHLSAGLIGLVTSSAAVGGLLGAALVTPISRRLGQGPALCIAIAFEASFGFAAPFVHRGWTYGILLAAEFGVGFTVVVYNVIQISFRQALCPPELLGRMNATIRFVVSGVMPFGGIIGGALGAALGVRPALLVLACAGLLQLVPALLSPLPKLRELPTSSEPVEPESGTLEVF
jgi:MFS family permease